MHRLPHLTQACAPLTETIEVHNALGERETLQIPAERPLTIYVDRRELVTLMTLGQHPEWLVLGYLCNQRLVDAVDEVESVTVDWEVNAAAVRTRQGQALARLQERSVHRVVTSGCGQGSVFGRWMEEAASLHLPPAQLTQAALYGIVNTIRLHDSIHKRAGSVHACALFQGDRLLCFVEDVGRHNAVDTIAGWMALQTPPVLGHDKVFYTTGRLTSEMVLKAAQMGVPILVSRSGITQMGLQLARQLGLCAIGRATHRRFLCYSGAERLVWQPELVQQLSAVAAVREID